MSEPACVNLLERFGRRYRVSWEADGVTQAQWATDDRPWLMEIRGRHGVVYPQGGEILQAVSNRSRLGGKLRALPCVLTARGDIQTVITFHIADAAAVFTLIKPRRRRQVSEEERERLARLRAVHGFKAQRLPCISESDFPAVESTIGTPNDPQDGEVP